MTCRGGSRSAGVFTAIRDALARKPLDTADPGQHLSHARNSSRTATQE
jgi:hypothetical protein